MNIASTISERNPQHIFWKQSDVDVPKDFEARLLQVFGKDEVGDPLVRVRLDAQRFREPVWVVEEKWSPAAFGSVEEWNKTKVMYEDGIPYDFGDFPSRGIYASVMLWTNHEGYPLPLNDDLIERLQYQRQAREAKNISPQQVYADTMRKEEAVEAQQIARYEQAQKELIEDLKKDKEKIFAATTRNYLLPNKILPLN